LAHSEQLRVIAEKKIEVMQTELEKAIKESHQLVLTVEKERAERVTLLQTA
jgi:hypothetical protein